MSPSTNNRPGSQDEVWVEAYLDQVDATIREHGWAIQSVFMEDGGGVDFVYTIGMMRRGCTAELMVVGLPVEVGAHLLNEIAANMIKDSQSMAPATWPLLNGLTLKARPFLPRRASRLTPATAHRYYGTAPIPIVQYVWPDQNACYPWDAGWDRALVQPVGNG